MAARSRAGSAFATKAERVAVSAGVLTPDPASHIAVSISIGVYGAAAVNAGRSSENRAVISRTMLASCRSSRISAAPLSQIGSVRADHVEPSFLEELTKSRCSRTSVLRVWITVGFNADDFLDDRVNGRCAGQLLASRIRRPMRAGRTKPAETTSDQEQACGARSSRRS
jgi:hypothetical protein